MLETTRIRKEGYAVRPTFEEFIHRYQILTYAWNLGQSPSAATCRAVLQRSKLDNWQIGKTKVRRYLTGYHQYRTGVPSIFSPR